ncbi:CHAD domain-containing protein [Campylobacter sp. faydin G-140]|uniref:CYTH and CHAD domain-containing protein n=1 Tax=Campylobacter anatolicus TaxID=2829105 RepID=UPI001B9629BF|nr:CHAD domain-containing protein [Campylobacter anatolicus]MBR8465091.1 CHAD domain-containing protein [Campylobacter anatolicus]
MGLEIERKFLLKNENIIEFLSNEGVSFKRLNILQFYTKISKNDEIRYRSESGKFIKTIKFGSDLVREENESECDESEFKDALKNRIGSLITKNRYLFRINNNPCNIDIFDGDLNGLCIFEVEFKDEAEAVYYQLPSFLLNFVAIDVTCDKRYKNKHIALYGNPHASFELERVFDVLGNSTNLELNLPKNLKSKDALRVLFFKLYKEICAKKSEYESSDDDEALHQFRINLRKIRSILKAFDGVFDKKITKIFSDEFKNLANLTNTTRDLDVFLQFLKKQKHSDEIVSFITQARAVQSKQLKEILSDDKKNEFLKEWELFLLEDSSFYIGEFGSSSIVQISAKRLRNELVALQRQISRLNDSCENESFHKIRIELKRLRYVYDSFSHLFYIKEFDKFSKRLRFMQELFGDLQDRDIWLGILKNMPLGENLAKIENKIYRQIYKLREKILKKNIKFMRSSRIISRSLKIYYI